MLSNEFRDNDKRRYRYRKGLATRREQEKEVFPLFEQGKTDNEIQSHMDCKFPGLSKTVKTYRNWWRQKEEDGRQVKVNRFQMEAAYTSELSTACHKSLSELLFYVHERGSNGQSLWFLSKGEDSPPVITNNEALWYCRLSELDSGLKPDSLYLMALVYSFRERFKNKREWFRQTFERDLNYNDLDLYMAFRPWENSDRHARYIRSVLDRPELCISVEEFKQAVEMKSSGNDEISEFSVQMYFRYSEYARGMMPGVIYYPEFESTYYDDVIDIVPPMPDPLGLLATLTLQDLVSELTPNDFAEVDGKFVNQGKLDPSLTILGPNRRPALLNLVDRYLNETPPFKYDYNQLKTEGTREFLLASLPDTDDWGYPEWEKLSNCIKGQDFQNLDQFLIWVLDGV